jgi:hypothetical protein
MRSCLNLFYQEPDLDRWMPFDRYPLRILRRLVRGRPSIVGQRRVFLNLCSGLEKLGVPYRVNDYRHAAKNPDELVCIIGKPHVLDTVKWQNSILFGAAVFSHPTDDPDILSRLPVKKVLVPGEWMRRMFEPYYGQAVTSWPVGIDTDLWSPVPASVKSVDLLLYDKVRWKHEEYERSLLEPIRQELRHRGLTFSEIRYGFYHEEQFVEALQKSRGMIFCCEHETQGIAYQQALAAGVPIFAWNRGGYWRDPAYFPHSVQFQPVSSIPYWDARCGLEFTDIMSFCDRIDEFWNGVKHSHFSPRDYIAESLTLEKCAIGYVELARQTSADGLTGWQ